MTGIADGPLTSLALCWRMERGDGAGLALTSHDGAFTHDGLRFEPTPGVTPATVSRSLGLEPDSSEIRGALSADVLADADLALGRWNGARIRLSAADWAAPDATPIGLLGGELGEVAIEGEGFTAELRGAASRLEQPVCPSTSPECRAQFGDKTCRVDLAGRSRTASVVAWTDGEIELDQPIGDTFLLGRLRFMRGANCGIATTIVAVSGAIVRLRDLPRAAVEIGCQVALREGCDKRLATCAGRFDNAVNFRGEPHLPGNDLLTRYPGA